MQLEHIKRLNYEMMQKNVELEANYSEIEATNEELETTNEELIATNEELEVANRDLFGMAEELKKSKEEIEKNMLVVQKANEELTLLNQLKTNFLGMASHELKTPLVMVKGYAELILDNKNVQLDGTTQEMTVQILKGADILNAIINDMLDITKIEAKELKLNLVAIELKLVIDSIISEMGAVAKSRGQRIMLGNIPDVNVTVDSPHMHRVLSHILSNAIKFTPDNGKIKVYAKEVKDDVLASMYGYAEPIEAIDIIVEDSGIGIDENDYDKIFDVFYEVGDIDHHRSSKSAYLGKGSGLGLPICKGIIEAHSGRIWVESEGVDLNTFPGSIFHVTLPLVQTHELRKEGEVATAPKKVETPAPKKRLKKQPKILLIEDENDIIELTSLVLESKFTIGIANNGADGIKKAFTFKPDAILLDIYMKGLNGYEVCSILKENEATKNIPIAMFTAGTQKYEIEKGYKVGVDDYITKPFNPSDLIARLEKLISKKKDRKK